VAQRPRPARVRRAPPTDRRSAARTVPVRRGPWRACCPGGLQGASGHGAWGGSSLGAWRAVSGGAGCACRGQPACGHGAWRTGARDVAARRHRGLDMLLVSCLNAVSPKICTGVHQVMNMKVVDLAILYNFHKGLIVFFSTDFA
jgi:hypothetical protein